jgi:hypothetical protein
LPWFHTENTEYILKNFLLLIVFACTVPAIASTWYVRPDGGTRFSVNQTSGQCNGLYNAAYPGKGINQNCAFGDVRYLWADGTYTTGTTFPGWGWVGTGGDTYIINCPADCRIGYNGPNPSDYFLGIAGSPYGSGAPPPPNGTASAHTRILGSNFADCTSESAKAQINGGYGAGAVFSFQGSSYVDFACFAITDHSSCGRAAQTHGCATSYPLGDYASNGIVTNNHTTNVTITDVRIHGMASAGMIGATGTGVSLERVALVGNASSGWNMDDGSGTTGTGTLSLDHFSVLWNGCAEEYPIVDALPYQDCTDDNTGGYGDGIGTATTVSNPAWLMTVTNSTAAYNTQDGFDLLHLTGGGSRLTITQSLAYGNMGQQLKVGSASIARNNLIVGNCNALREPIPGVPAGYNSRLSDYCRAADGAVLLTVQDSTPTYFQFNTLYAANSTGIDIECNGTCSSESVLDYEDNIFVGFLNNTADGYPGGGTGDYSNPLYVDVNGLFSNAGSVFSHNVTYHPKSTWRCPATEYQETDGICSDPQLADESWHVYGYGNMSPIAGSRVLGAGMPIAGVTTDNTGGIRPNPPAIGALQFEGVSAQSQVKLAVSPSPAVAGEPVTLTATVSENGSAAPSGTVTFLNGTTTIGSASVDSAGSAILEVPSLAIGSYAITADYSGNASYGASQSGVTTLTVDIPTTTRLAASVASSTYGQVLTLTAIVKSSENSAAAGTVTFLDGAVSVGTGTLNASGVATFATALLQGGNHTLTAEYAGKNYFLASSSGGVAVSVKAQSTTTTMTASVSAGNVTKAACLKTISSVGGSGQAVVLTATVKGSGALVPSGNVTFYNGSVVLGTATLNASGVATLTTTLSAGTHTLDAQFSGNRNFLSSSASVQINVGNHSARAGFTKKHARTQAWKSI